MFVEASYACFLYYARVILNCCVIIQKDDSSLMKHDETSRLVTDNVGVDADCGIPHCNKPADSPSNSRPTFHRPFLDVEDSGTLPEKLYKLCAGDGQNGVCVVPLHTDPLPTLLQKTPSCNWQSAESVSENSVSRCDLDEQGLCKDECCERRDDDSGRDKRLHAALGLISLADVSSDVAAVRPKSRTDSPTEDCCDGEIFANLTVIYA